MFTPEFRLKLWSQMLYALDYGNAKFEVIWEVREGRWWVVRCKPLAVDRNEILIDAKGNFVGIRYGAANEWLDRRKAFLFTYEGEAGNLHGEPRLENIRGTAWRDWLDTAQQLQWITQKVAGKLCIITTPSGSYTNAAGEQKSYKEAAMMAGKAIADPRSNGVVWFPTAALPDNIKKENVDLVKAPLVQIQVVDFGKYGDAIAPTLQRLQWNEGLMSAGYLRSPRTNQESEHGSRADAEAHTQIDIVDMELVDGQMCMQFCEQVVDQVLAVNYGDAARGKVVARAGRMTDENLEWDRIIINGVIANPELSGQFLAGEAGVDIDAVAGRRGIPKKEREIELTDEVEDDGDTAPGDDTAPGGSGDDETELSRDVDGGQWVTIRGVHVYVKDGKIEKGPSDMVGKSPDEAGGSQGGSHPQSAHDIVERFPGIKAALSERDKSIVLSKVIVPEGDRGKGSGTSFMRSLCAYADSEGKTIALTPSADFGGSVSRLKEFYKRFGFVENKGRKRDFEISESMYRVPNG